MGGGRVRPRGMVLPNRGASTGCRTAQKDLCRALGLARCGRGGGMRGSCLTPPSCAAHPHPGCLRASAPLPRCQASAGARGRGLGWPLAVGRRPGGVRADGGVRAANRGGNGLYTGAVRAEFAPVCEQSPGWSAGLRPGGRRSRPRPSDPSWPPTWPRRAVRPLKVAPPRCSACARREGEPGAGSGSR